MLWIPQVNYRVHKTPLLAPILNQINPVHTTPSYFCKIRFNIILTPTSGFIPSGFPTKILYAFLFDPMRAHLILLDLTILIIIIIIIQWRSSPYRALASSFDEVQ
jgi:hypothetical protein